MKLKITVDGKLYEVEVEVAEQERIPATYAHRPTAGAAVSAATSAPAPTSASDSATVADESKVCRSPISGVVVRVSVEPGENVEENGELLVLEAMKMESVITAPVAGTVAKVNAAVGDAVKGGQVLVEFE